MIKENVCLIDFHFHYTNMLFTRSVFLPPKQSYGEDYDLLKPTDRDQLLRLLGDDDYPVANQELELVIFCTRCFLYMELAYHMDAIY
jgi:hypothetical protein